MRSLMLFACATCLMSSSASGQSYNMNVRLKTGEVVVIPIDDIRRIELLVPTGVHEPETATDGPVGFQLLQNYPNPFNPSTTITYDIPAASEVSVRIFDLRGSLIRDLLRDYQGAGRHQVSWDGTDDVRARVSSGVYFVAVEIGEQVLSRRLLLVK